MKGLFAVALSTVLAIGSASPVVYLIRHGEKPDSGNGLSPQGEERAKCLVNVFGSNSTYNIDYIMAQDPKSDGSEQRPYDTVEPLATSLGLTIDKSCDRDDSQCVANVVDNYSGKGNILICWEHQYLSGIVQALGDQDAPDYPSDRFDLIWTDPSPYNSIISQTSENCPGLDNNSTSAFRHQTYRRPFKG